MVGENQSRRQFVDSGVPGRAGDRTRTGIRREPMAVGERRQFRMAWIFAPDLTVHPQSQSYTRLADRLYLFENFDGSGFRAELPVDEDGIVLDYPDLFRRVKGMGERPSSY